MQLSQIRSQASRYPMVPGLLFIVVLSPLGWAIRQPPDMVVILGKPLTLNCSLSKTTQLMTMYWYKQAVGKDTRLQLVVFSTEGSGANVEKPFEGHFQSNGTKNYVLSLSAESAQMQDSGTYYCAKQGDRRNAEAYFGEGTRLTVLEDLSNITAPEVAIFPPSKQEIKQKRKATLVCLATNFYPDHIKLVWRVNGDERKEGVRTDESLLDKNKEKYSLTSRLRISHQEWSNPKNRFQCFVEFYGSETISYDKVINGVADCSVSEESYLRSAMAGKSVYVLLIFKSALYGVFVMGLMLRNKQVQ